MDALSLQVAAAAASSKCAAATGPCAFSDRWADFYANYVAPTRDVVVPAVCVFLAILVLARLVPLAMPVGDGVVVSRDPAQTGVPRDPGASPRRRRAARLVLGIALALAAALSVALWLPDIGPRSVQWWMILVTVLAGLGAATLIGLWMGSRLRLTIDATAQDGSKSSAAAAHVAARVGDLGGSAPGGLELARGTDTSALLGSALTDVPEGKLAQLAVRIVQGTLGISPWRANVDQFDDTTVSVVVTRNGRQAGSAVIDSRLLLGESGLPSVDANADKIDMHRFVAAVVVTTLARFHPNEFAGLCGASDWRSLGYYYLGSTRYDTPDYYDAQKRVFARAVELDPNNWLAQLGFRRAVDRRSSDPAELARYRSWLQELLRGNGAVLSRPGFETLRLRALYTCLSLSINAMFALASGRQSTGSSVTTPDALSPEPSPGPSGRSAETSADHPTWAQAADDALDLLDALASAGDNPRSSQDRNAHLVRDLVVAVVPLAQTIVDRGTLPDDKLGRITDSLRRYAGALDLATPEPDQAPDPTGALSTKALYNTGCYYGSLPTLDEKRALRYLRLAVKDPRYSQWALGDPQLAELRAHESFWSELGHEPRSEFLDLGLAAPFAERLRGAGLATAREITRRSVDQLVEQTGARPAEAQALRDLAHLSVDAPPSLKRIGTEVLYELIGRGCARRGALRRLGARNRQSLADDVLAALGKRIYVSAAEATSLRRWLGAPCRRSLW